MHDIAIILKDRERRTAAMPIPLDLLAGHQPRRPAAALQPGSSASPGPAGRPARPARDEASTRAPAGRRALPAVMLVLAVAATLAAAALPPASAQQPQAVPVAPQAAPVTLYFHVNGIQEFAVTVQPPPQEFRQTVALGAAATTQRCLPEPTGSAGLANQDFHTWRGHLSPGPVAYAGPNPGPVAERGLAADAVVRDAFELFWYVEAGVLEREAPVPQVTARATLRSGSPLHTDPSAYDAGTLLAEGEAGPFTLSPTPVPSSSATGRLERLTVDGRNVYGFVVPMRIVEATWPANEGVNLRIDLQVDEPLCGDGRVMPNAIRLHTSAAARPRMVPLVEQPLAVAVSTSPAGNSTVLVTARVTSPFGAHDVANVTLEAHGPSPVRLTPVPVEELYVHGEALRPHERSWTWDASDAAAGTYTFTASASNLQQSATAQATESIPLGSARDSPSLPAALLLGVLALGVVLVRRR